MTKIQIDGNVNSPNVNLGGNQVFNMKDSECAECDNLRRKYKFALLEIKDFASDKILEDPQMAYINEVVDKALKLD